MTHDTSRDGSREAAARATWNTSKVMEPDSGQTPYQRQEWAEQEKQALEASGEAGYDFEAA
jgi:hypothetical protein